MPNLTIRGLVVVMVFFLVNQACGDLATFSSLPSVLNSRDSQISLVVGFNQKVPTRVQFIGFRGCVADSSCNQVTDLVRFTANDQASFWRSAINYTDTDYDGYCGGELRVWYNDSTNPVTEPLVQGNRTFNILLQRGIQKVPQPPLTSLLIDPSGFARAVFAASSSSLRIRNVTGTLRCGDTADPQNVTFTSSDTSAFTNWNAQLEAAPQDVLCLMTTLDVSDSMGRSQQYTRLNRPYWNGAFPLTQLSFADETPATVPFPTVYRVTATISVDSTVGSQWTDVGVRISDCLSQPKDVYFGGVSGEFTITGIPLPELKSSRCLVTLLFKSDTQVDTVAPEYISPSLPSMFDINFQSRVPSLVSLRVSPRVISSTSDGFSIDATLSGSGDSNFTAYAILRPQDLLLPGDPDATGSIALTPVAGDIDNTSTSGGTWERRWRASNVRFANVAGTRGGKVSFVCVPFPWGNCVSVTDTVSSSITLQSGSAYSPMNVTRFNFSRCAGTGTLYSVELEVPDSAVSSSCSSAPLATIRTQRIFQCDEMIEVPLRCISVHPPTDSSSHSVRVVYAPQRILHSSEQVQLRVKLNEALPGPSLVRNYTIPLTQDPRGCSFLTPSTGPADQRRRPIGAVLGFTLSLLILAILLLLGVWQRRRIKNFLSSLRPSSGLQPSASTSSIDSSDDRKDLMDRDEDMTL